MTSTKSASEINELMGSGDIRQAASKAAQLAPRIVADAIDYHALFADAEPWLSFARLWIEAADPLDRPEIAAWLVDRSVSEMSYLRVQEEAASLLARVTREATNRLAEILDQATVLSSGPDAGITKAQAEEYAAAAAALRRLPLTTATRGR